MIALRSAFALLALFGLGCGHSLVVRHLDRGGPDAYIRVGNDDFEPIQYGESLSVRLESGAHTVSARTAGGQPGPWLETGDSWNIVVLDDVVLSLLPKPAPGRPDHQGTPAP